MASTKMNDVSSRSHAMIEISVGRKKYTLVDMAGQESGATCSDNEKLVQKQGRAINLNMLALKECIRRYNKKEKHIPFRGCLLTLALKLCLWMIAMWPLYALYRQNIPCIIKWIACGMHLHFMITRRQIKIKCIMKYSTNTLSI